MKDEKNSDYDLKPPKPLYEWLHEKINMLNPVEHYRKENPVRTVRPISG
jgi:hypothetical protein